MLNVRSQADRLFVERFFPIASPLSAPHEGSRAEGCAGPARRDGGTAGMGLKQRVLPSTTKHFQFLDIKAITEGDQRSAGTGCWTEKRRV